MRIEPTTLRHYFLSAWDGHALVEQEGALLLSLQLGRYLAELEPALLLVGLVSALAEGLGAVLAPSLVPGKLLLGFYKQTGKADVKAEGGR